MPTKSLSFAEQLTPGKNSVQQVKTSVTLINSPQLQVNDDATVRHSRLSSTLCAEQPSTSLTASRAMEPAQSANKTARVKPQPEQVGHATAELINKSANRSGGNLATELRRSTRDRSEPKRLQYTADGQCNLTTVPSDITASDEPCFSSPAQEFSTIEDNIPINSCIICVVMKRKEMPTIRT